MSALAQFVRWEGCVVGGSDRSLGDSATAKTAEGLRRIGCSLAPQDGSGVSRTTDVVVASTAIEGDNSDMRQATQFGLPVVHRSDVLAALVERYRTIAVAGTSGKSTVTALCFDCLERCGRSPSIIGGANLLSLTTRNAVGNAWHGSSDVLVIEADESDGTLVKYRPDSGLFLNVSRDHKPIDETMALFHTLADNCGTVVVNADDPHCAQLPHDATFGIDTGDHRPQNVYALSPSIRFRVHDTDFTSPLPGVHNLSNIMAALTVCMRLGCGAEELATALPDSGQLERRFNRYDSDTGVIVIDDFAHNPAKIAAAVQAAQPFGRRLIAVFQPHGYGPTRFMREELITTIAQVMRSDDRLLMLPIYYAGGTAQRDISSDELVDELRQRGVDAEAPADRSACTARIAELGRPGDVVLSMGARDPSLPELARSFVSAINDASVGSGSDQGP